MIVKGVLKLKSGGIGGVGGSLKVILSEIGRYAYMMQQFSVNFAVMIILKSNGNDLY